ncbi:aromatic ring-opening dioxygenase, catalytic subunit LigB [Aeromicrobium marinum DSM 15272]|uniref:Aromatic ring-opening dioxygenase, catalytic subunit LigB n=1 Tax=Aeromicrobium marinum DSM 15272 TaxID=585531 RepID=E2SAG7_9ACTN|nr:class III extradiol ring-cleavage dioxygenase [Aeromicrobium marinum]EFQ84241.1 aromatic ring-opening dioxygenase, catalytic subunit LigB [Aeromicrobium marinum DSM 15272]
MRHLEARLRPSPRMPVLFIGHGNPMHAISDNAFTRQWAALGAELPPAQAIVVISAHWQTPGSTRVTDAPRNRVIYDFGGFPDELSQVRYDSAGDPEVARILTHHLAEYEAQLDAQWGLDHGTWSVLTHLAPAPQVPVLQISIDAAMPLPALHDLYARLRDLRHRGVLFIGSGNIVHALGRVRWEGGGPWDWAEEFDAVTAEAIAERRVDLLTDPFGHWPSARIAVPTDDHYRPMIAALSLLEPGEETRFFNEQIDLGSIGMRSFVTA